MECQLCGEPTGSALDGMAVCPTCLERHQEQTGEADRQTRIAAEKLRSLLKGSRSIGELLRGADRGEPAPEAPEGTAADDDLPQPSESDRAGDIAQEDGLSDEAAAPLVLLARYAMGHAVPVRLGPGGEAVVGRDAEQCAVVLRSKGVSRRHCRITVFGDWGWVEDLGSRNGTIVNGQRVESYPLGRGDVVHIGTCTVEVW